MEETERRDPKSDEGRVDDEASAESTVLERGHSGEFF
jgi:hypothetical protein